MSIYRWSHRTLTAKTTPPSHVFVRVGRRDDGEIGVTIGAGDRYIHIADLETLRLFSIAIDHAYKDFELDVFAKAYRDALREDSE